MFTLWSLFVTLLIGFFVGLLARALHPGDDRMGFFMTSILGIGGSVLATIAGQALHFYRPGHSAGFIGATLGAIVLLMIAHGVRRMAR